MSPAKKQESSASAPFWQSWLSGAGQPVLIVALLIGLFGGGAYWAWLKVKPRILGSPEYFVSSEQVEITGLPPWIHQDIRNFRAEVFRDPTLAKPLRLTDDDLLERISKAFAQHPWVAKVLVVAKQYPAAGNPASVKVALSYRRPVCMVEVPGEPLPAPVDVDSVLLPNEGFSPIEARGYPRLVGVERGPVVAPGRRWGDAVVIGGAEIAAVLGPAWQAMKLDRIVPLVAGADARGRLGEPRFALMTPKGTRIFWGYAPNAGVLGEIPAAEKVARLQQLWNKDDTFDGPQGQPQQLDIRSMAASVRP
jgi:hypothetical protein